MSRDEMITDQSSRPSTARFLGTHDGSFPGVPATGRPVDVPGITILRFADGRCVERWAVADFLAVMIQIGAVPAPA